MKLPKVSDLSMQQKLSLVITLAGVGLAGVSGGLLALAGLALCLSGVYMFRLEREVKK